jgi:hypothetical protein
MIIGAKYWLGTNIDYNLTSISSSFLSSFPSSFANLRAFQSQNDFWPGRALRRWIDSETNTDWLTNGVRLSRSSIDVVIQSIRWWLCGGPAPEPICLSQRHSIHVANYYHSDILQKGTCYRPFSPVAASAEPLAPLPRLYVPSPLAPSHCRFWPLRSISVTTAKSLLLPLLSSSLRIISRTLPFHFHSPPGPYSVIPRPLASRENTKRRGAQS